MRVLVTGSCGFVGQFLCDRLAKEGHEVFGFGVHGCHASHTDYRFADIRKAEEVDRLIADIKPDEVYHLAALSHVPGSWEAPAKTFEINVMGSINLISALGKHSPSAKVLVVGTAAEYGNVRPEDCPIPETHPLKPNNPYAVSKITQSQLALQLGAKYGLEVVCTRSFNHTGPGQQETFVCPAFAKQFAEAELDPSKKELVVGNIDPVRDFSDVRDVVNAYVMLLREGVTGETYNVCSGVGYSVRDVINILQEYSSAKLEIKESQDRLRTVESWHVVGDNSKLREATGWQMQFELRQTLEDLLNWWREELKEKRDDA